MRKKILFYTIVSMLVLSGCSAGQSTQAASSAIESTAGNAGETSEEASEADPDESKDDQKDDDSDKDATPISLTDQKEDINITEGGSYCLTGSSKDIMVNVNAGDKVTLILDNVTMENSNGPCIYIQNEKKTEIRLVGTSTISDTRENLDKDEEEEMNAAIFSEGKLVFSGDGTLKLSTESAKGIKSGDDLTIKSGTYEITAADDAIRAKKNLTISDGIIDISSETEGIESKDAIIINGGTISVRSEDDGINAASSIVINDGNLKVISTGNDAVDSNGSLEINGGYIEAYGLSTPEGAYDNDSGTFTINGGTVIGLGSANSFPNAGEQKTLMLAPDTEDAIETIEIHQNGNTLLSVDFDDYSDYKSQKMPDFNDNHNTPDPAESENIAEASDGSTETPAQDTPHNMPAPPSINGETVNEEDAKAFFDNLDQQGGRPGFGGNERPQFGPPQEGAQSVQDDAQNAEDGSAEGSFIPQFGFQGGFGGSDSSVNVFLSVPGLEDGSIEIYINGELWQEAEITDLVTSVGNVNTMFAGVSGGGQQAMPDNTQDAMMKPANQQE